MVLSIIMSAGNQTGPVDLHLHGVGGFDTQTESSDDILSVARIQAAEGVAAVLLSIYPAPIPTMRRHMAAVKEAMERQRSAASCQQPVRRFRSIRYETDCALPAARVLGIHLEGPFLNPARCGALNSRTFLCPSEHAYSQLIEGFEDTVKTITIAPELPGALELIRQIARSGLVVNMGHSDATYSEAEMGFRAGATGIAHIFNAMRPFAHREPGIAGFGLSNPHIYVEVIADPHHLHLETIRLIFKAKAANRVLVVSDSVKDISMGTPSSGGQAGQGREAGESTRAVSPTGRLRGGSMSIISASKRLIANGFDQSAIMQAITDNPNCFLNKG